MMAASLSCGEISASLPSRRSSRTFYGRLYNSSGGTVVNEFTINSVTGDMNHSPSVSMTPDGKFVVAWARGLSGNSLGVFDRRYDSSGVALGAEQQVNAVAASFQDSPAVSHGRCR
jgi:hypothetical protein